MSFSLQQMHDDFVAVSKSFDFGEGAGPHRKAFTLLKALREENALQTFEYSGCIYDSGHDVLYAMIKPHPNASIEDSAIFTRDDFYELQESVDELADKILEVEDRTFYDRLNIEINRAIEGLTANAKTVTWHKQQNQRASGQSALSA